VSTPGAESCLALTDGVGISSGSGLTRSGSVDLLDLSSLNERDAGGAAIGSSSVTLATLRKFVTSNPPLSLFPPEPVPSSCNAPKLLRFLGAPADRPTSFHRLRFSFSSPEPGVPGGGVFSRSIGEHAVSGELSVDASETVDPAEGE